jgi:hypothetical protein
MSPKRASVADRTSIPEQTAGRRQLSIVVAGDLTIDWLADVDVDWVNIAGGHAAGSEVRLPDARGTRRHNYQLHRGIRMEALQGGALLLAREVRLACQDVPGAVARVIGQQLHDVRSVPPEQVLHSVVELKAYPESGPDEKSGPKVFRVGRFLGFSGPLEGTPEPLPIPDDDPNADIVVLDDAGNAFRDRERVWPLAVRTEGKQPLLIMKMTRPLSGGPLYERVRKDHGERLVLVVNADDLRAEGVDISRRLSWERTAREFLWQMCNNPDLASLRGLPNLVVRLGVDGAIHYAGAGNRMAARLYYDPAKAEDGFREANQGEMIGLTDAFIAALVGRIAREGPTGIGEGIRDGIQSSRRFFRLGFGKDRRHFDYPGAEVFGPPAPGDDAIADAVIPASDTPNSADPDYWCLLNEVQDAGLEVVARQLVLNGEAVALRNVPVGEFGGLRTVDRAEIESLRSVRNLIRQYLGRKDTKRPLSLAVFGPPGSGKSFGVEQVAKSVARLSQRKVEKLEFNLSQFETTRDLVAALHRVRDEVLRGGVPLVFFDEFDCAFQGPLGWLRYFLAPMQDGAFKDGETMHPIGPAIFVFAGGLSRTFAHFSRETFDEEIPEESRPEERRRFTEAKGPDFVSRLRGFVNILGPNPDHSKPDDRLYLIRRATVLRSLLRRSWGTLIDPEEPSRLNIDEAVLRALIGVPEYKHGVRSMEAVLEMSLLEGRTGFEPSALPPPEQLEQHVDADAFSRLVLQGLLFAAAREAIAQAIHERFQRDRARDKPLEDPSLRPWQDLAEPLKRSNRAQADDILRKLEQVGCGYRPRRDDKPVTFRFKREEIELLAELEHDRWMKDKVAEGFTLGPRRDEERKTSPYLVAWNQLEDQVKQYDRDTVAAIPEFMAGAAFEVYRL